MTLNLLSKTDLLKNDYLSVYKIIIITTIFILNNCRTELNFRFAEFIHPCFILYELHDKLKVTMILIILIILIMLPVSDYFYYLDALPRHVNRS